MTTSCHHHTVDLMVWQWPKTSTNGTTGSVLHMTWAFLWKTWVIKTYQSRDGHVVAQATRNLYQSAITIWHRTKFSTQLLLMKLSTIHRSLDIAEESHKVLEESLSHVRRLNWRVGRIRSDLGSKYVTKLRPPRRNDATIFEMLKSKFKILNSRWMARKSMASSSVTTIRWMKWRTRSITAWWPQIFFGNTCTVIWTGSIKLVHSGWSYSPFVFAKRPHFFDKLHTLFCDMSSRLQQNHGRYKGRA